MIVTPSEARNWSVVIPNLTLSSNPSLITDLAEGPRANYAETGLLL